MFTLTEFMRIVDIIAVTYPTSNESILYKYI